MPQIGIADKQTLDLVRSEIGRVQTAGGWAGAVFDGCGLSDGKVKLSSATTQGTASLDISPSSLYAWRNLYFKTKKPANTNITCAVKDTSDNVLIADIADGGDLSSIDPTQYKTLRLVWTLTRNSVEDESPELHEPFWSWLGVNIDIEKKILTNVQAQQHATNTVLDITGSGTLLAINMPSSASTLVTVQIDGGAIIKITVGNYEVFYTGEWKFKTGLKICSDIGSIIVLYKLD